MLLSPGPVYTSNLQRKDTVPVDRDKKTGGHLITGEREEKKVTGSGGVPATPLPTVAAFFSVSVHPKSRKLPQRAAPQPASQPRAPRSRWPRLCRMELIEWERRTDNRLHVTLCWPVAASRGAERRRALSPREMEFSTEFIQRGEENKSTRISPLCT